MWDAVYGGLEPQPWHNNIIRASLYPNFSKLAPTPQRYLQCKGASIETHETLFVIVFHSTGWLLVWLGAYNMNQKPVNSQSWVCHESVTSDFWGCQYGTPIDQEEVQFFSTKLYGHHQVSKLNMSEHFLEPNKAFEILANLGLEPLIRGEGWITNESLVSC